MGSPSKNLTFFTKATFGNEIAFNEDIPEIGKESSFILSLNYKLGNNISLNPSLRFSSLRKTDDSEFFYIGYISRLSSRYQFNNDLSLRVISEYNKFTDTFYIQPLLEWNPNPSTIFYIGGNQSSINDFDLGMDSVAESFGLIHTVDALYGLMRGPLEQRMKIKLIANRDNGYEESYKFYDMKKDYMRLEESVGENSEYYSDDEEIGRMENELRDSYKTISPSETFESNATNNDSSNYDSLLSQI